MLERWITPSLFESLSAQDEYSFCLELGEKKKTMLQQHWKSFISDEDLRWIANTGLNAVRVPVGHWIFGDCEPYVGSINVLDWLLETANRYGLKVVIDLHGAPGSQNGHDHSGRSGEVGWHKSQGNIDHTVDIAAKLAARYKDSPALAGIELLNEPHHKLHKRALIGYYKLAYEAVRKYLPEDKAVIISDGFRPKKWKKELTGQDYKNVWLDMHLYQCFDKADKKLDLAGNIAKTAQQAKLIDSIRKERPVMIGEWSLGLDCQAGTEKLKAYAKAQIEAYNHANGWFFWTYKTHDKSGWNFRHCVESGLLFGAAADDG